MIDLLPRLRRFAYALTGNMDMAEDLVQETCLKALASAHQWTPGTRLDSWMYRIAQNISRDQRRFAKSRGENVDVDALEDLVGSDGRNVTEHQLMLQAVVQSIAKLPEDQQLALALVCLDGYSYKEAADALNIPIGTIMSRLSRARKTLHDDMPDSMKTN